VANSTKANHVFVAAEKGEPCGDRANDLVWKLRHFLAAHGLEWACEVREALDLPGVQPGGALVSFTCRDDCQGGDAASADVGGGMARLREQYHGGDSDAVPRMEMA
jgi:hypothetical protein